MNIATSFKITLINVLCIVILTAIVFACAQASAGQRLTIFHAGSLSIPFEKISLAFKKTHPDIEIMREAAGSRTCARKITDLGRKCDIMASADYTVIEDMLMPKHATWNISFATNKMAIMYSPNSRYSKEINADNWHEILLRKDVEYGHSDPNTDPCGYRTLMVWQLAERYYHVPGLYQRLKEGCPTKNTRPKETDLIALLEAGELDYIFIYQSVCIQHQMPFVELPDQINLGSPQYADLYAKAQVKINGKTPGTFIIKQGRPMIYGITIPKDAPNKELATKFIAFLIGPEGKKILERNGQPPLEPPEATGNMEEMPDLLKKMCRIKDYRQAR